MQSVSFLIAATCFVTSTIVAQKSTGVERRYGASGRLISNGCTSRGDITSLVKDTSCVLDRASGKWYATGTQGPCGKNMRFYSHPLHPDSQYGFCDCDQGVRDENPCIDHPIRSMIYLPYSKQCVPVFSQGPCKDGQWLNFGKDGESVECQPNPCISTGGGFNNNKHTFWFFDPKRKACFQANTKGYCPGKLELRVTHDSHIPKCRKTCPVDPQLANFRSSLTCKPGNRYSRLLKGCVKSARFLFGIG